MKPPLHWKISGCELDLLNNCAYIVDEISKALVRVKNKCLMGFLGVRTIALEENCPRPG